VECFIYRLIVREDYEVATVKIHIKDPNRRRKAGKLTYWSTEGHMKKCELYEGDEYPSDIKPNSVMGTCSYCDSDDEEIISDDKEHTATMNIVERSYLFCSLDGDRSLINMFIWDKEWVELCYDGTKLHVEQVIACKLQNTKERIIRSKVSQNKYYQCLVRFLKGHGDAIANIVLILMCVLMMVMILPNDT
jgi:hypothetical protein